MMKALAAMRGPLSFTAVNTIAGIVILVLIVRKLSHASIEISGWGGSLVTDPWYEGSAFADSWELCDPPFKGAYELLSACSFLYISHGHPDHFSPETLKKIPPDRRSLIKVLILKSKTNKPLVSWFERHGFQVVEISSCCPTPLLPGLQIEIGEVHFGDSWMLLSYGDSNLLNINDCFLGPSDLRYLSKKGLKFELVALQYGVANWTGNPDDVKSRRLSALAVLKRVEKYVCELKPATVMPFASEFRFFRLENQHLNDSQNTMEDVAKLLDAIGQNFILMNNGDSWSRTSGLLRVSNPPSCLMSSRSRSLLTSEVGSAPIQQSEFQMLDSARRETVAAFHGKLRTSVYRRLIGFSRLGSLVVRIGETRALWTVTMKDVRSPRSNQNVDLEISSEMFTELLGNFYGVDNLFIGGRFRRISDDALLKLGIVFGLERLGGMGIKLGVAFLRPTLLSAVLRRWKGATGRYNE